MSVAEFNFYVSADGGGKSYRALYNGGDAADAMAAWSKALTEGKEYIVLEALREVPPLPRRSP